MSGRLDRKSRGNLEKASSRLFNKWIPIMLKRTVTLGRYVAFVAVVAALAASVALILYGAAVVAEVIFSAIKQGGFQLQSGKTLAVGLIVAIDVFLIAIVALVTGLGLHGCSSMKQCRCHAGLRSTTSKISRGILSAS